MQTTARQILALNNAAVIYENGTPGGRTVWSRVDFSVSAGEWVAVIGANGSGKSTLASVLLGLCPLSAGTREAAEPFAIRGVLQAPEAQCVGDTVEEEFSCVPGAPELPGDAFARMCGEALRAVGLDVPPGRSVHRLSGGQLQLLHLAVALASLPELLVLDEPTAMLDPEARSGVLRAVRRIARSGAAVVWVTHRMEEAAEADRIFAFGGGGVVFDGEPRSFFYGDGEEEAPCAALGMPLPFAVRTARLLLERGRRLDPLPLNPQQLAKAVTARCL